MGRENDWAFHALGVRDYWAFEIKITLILND